MTERFKQEAESMEELRDIIRRAGHLGFEPVEYAAEGEWEAANGDPLFISGYTIEVEKVGQKYLHAEVDGETTRLEFGSESEFRDAGSITVTLEGER